MLQPAPALARHGVDLVPLPLLSAEEARRFAHASLAVRGALVLRARRRVAARLQAEGREWDAALVHRRADLLPSLRLERLAAGGRRLVYDVDDAIWLDVRRGGGAHRLAAFKATPRKVRWLAARADHVMAGNAILADHLSKLSSSVSIVPSLVDPGAIAVRRHADGPELVLGWIGSRTTAPFVQRRRALLAQLAAALPGRGLRLLMVGGTIDPVEGLELEARPWSPDAQADALGRMDVGLMPLPDTPWSRGKCAYKALQYMAAGVPVLADEVGIAGEVVGDGGYVVSSDRQWLDALVALSSDRALRGRLGTAGRRRVEAEFSLERWAPVVAGLLRGAPASGTLSPAVTTSPGAGRSRA